MCGSNPRIPILHYRSRKRPSKLHQKSSPCSWRTRLRSWRPSNRCQQRPRNWMSSGLATLTPVRKTFVKDLPQLFSSQTGLALTWIPFTTLRWRKEGVHRRKLWILGRRRGRERRGLDKGCLFLAHSETSLVDPFQPPSCLFRLLDRHPPAAIHACHLQKDAAHCP